MVKGKYSDKPLSQRLVLFIAGFTNFIMGYAIYFILKDDKSKEWQLEFLQRGSVFGFVFFVISLIGLAINKLFF